MMFLVEVNKIDIKDILDKIDVRHVLDNIDAKDVFMYII